MSRRDLEDVYPLSPLQQGILFHALYSRHQAMYVEQFPMVLEGELDVAAWGRAFASVVARHPALRTAFVWEKVPQPLQAVFPRAEPDVTVLDWSDADEAAFTARLTTWVLQDRRRAFDLKKPPLVRLALMRLGPARTAMVITFHHAVLDGWSLPLLFADWGEFYRRETEGGAVDLAPAPKYRDYVAWLARQDAAAAERFWCAALDGFAAPTPLPLDRGGAGVAETHEMVKVALPAASVDRLTAFARAHAVTPGTLVQAAWALVLAAFSGEKDVVFGTTVSGRPADLAGVERTVGLFINTLPVRAVVDPDRPVGDWLAALQRAHAEAQAFSHARLVDVHGWSAVPRDRPLFESLLVYESYPLGTSDDDGLKTRPAPVKIAERTNYPLALVVTPWGGLELRLTYDTRRFTEADALRILTAVAAALEGLAEDADRPLAAVSLVSPDDRDAQETWGTGAAARFAAPVHRSVESIVDETPDATAIEFGQRAWTYAEVDRRADALAARLRSIGVGPESRVAIHLHRSIDLPVAALAVLKAGGCCVPVDPAYPAARVAWMLEDCRPAAVVTTADLASGLSVEAPIVRIDEVGDDAGKGEGVRSTDVDPDHPAYVLYTSGSTGRPKGVAMPHGALATLVEWQVGRWAGDRPRTLQFAPASFDVWFQEVFATWRAGGTLVGVDDETRRDPRALAAFVRERRIARLFLPFSALQALAESAVSAGDAHLPELRAVAAAGEALVGTPPLRDFFRANPRARLENQYGPTETHVASVHTLAEDAAAWPALPPVGRPVDGAVLRVLDASMRPLPAGAPGELWVGGNCLARGYIDRPAITAERFVPDPLTPVPGARLYRTGDRARWTAEGEIEYLGRADEQVKVRGVRVEPGEVEAAIASHPGVLHAAVAARGEGIARRLVAYVAGRSAEIDLDAVRAHAAARLPDAMVPTAWMAVDRLPATPSGKVDRRALPDPDPSAAGPPRVEPRTDTERRLAAVWTELLGGTGPGAGDSFFALGGHSLLAMRLATRVRDAFGADLPLRAFFEAPTLEAMAERIDAETDAGLAALLAEVEAMPEDEAKALVERAEA